MAKYDDIDFSPPQGVREEAKKGLEWRKEYGRGGTEVGVARARDLSNGKNISPETARRMNSFFARHESNKSADGWSPGDDGFPSAGRIAWALWGGDPGKAWAAKLVRQMESRDKERTMKLKPKKHIPAAKLVMRMVDIRRELAQEESSSVPVIIATENPVERYDDSSDQNYAEVLLMDGVEFRGGRTQLPIVDSHDRSTTRNVLGSVRNLRVEGTQLVGDATFARDVESQIAYQKLLDGHLTDFSITATPVEQVSVRRGESYQTTEREVFGPAVVVTRWQPVDASLVAAGADETSTVRELLRSYKSAEVKRMISEEMKTKLVAMGMPEQIEDMAEAMAWAIDYMSEAKAEPEVENMEEESEELIESAEDSEMVEKMEEEKETVENALKRERVRQKEIRALCGKAKLERAFADQLCDSGVTLEKAREKVLQRMFSENKPVGTSARVEVKTDNFDSVKAAARDGLVSRCIQAAGSKRTVENPAKGHEDFARMPLLRAAEIVLRASGVDTDRISNSADLAKLAIGHRATVERFRSAGIVRDAYHTTGSFANLMLDAANKTLLQGYDEAPQTWNIWARQAPSVSDFKAINRIRFSESPDPEMVPERHEYKEKAFSDSKESYNVEKYGALFTVSWETVINDDLDAISRVPQMHGNACRRKVNRAVYAVLTSNPTMGDGEALFSASHASGRNLASSTGAPSVATMNAGYQFMMLQKGLTTDAILNIQPRYLIVPATLSSTALQLVGSLADPAAGGSATTGNSNTLNIYGPNGPRPIQVVVEPQLDASSTASWYLSADPLKSIPLRFRS